MLLGVTRRRMPVTVLLRRGAGSARRAGWGIADQGMSSITDFLIVLPVARSVGAVGSGANCVAD